MTDIYIRKKFAVLKFPRVKTPADNPADGVTDRFGKGIRLNGVREEVG